MKKIALGLLLGVSTAYCDLPLTACAKYLKQAEASYEKKDIDGFGRYAKKAYDQNPNDWHAALEVSAYLIHKKDYTFAQAFAKVGLQKTTDKRQLSWLHSALAISEKALGHNKSARKSLEQAIKENPKSPTIQAIKENFDNNTDSLVEQLRIGYCGR